MSWADDSEPLDFPWGRHHERCDCEGCFARLRNELIRLRCANAQAHDTKQTPPRAGTPEGLDDVAVTSRLFVSGRTSRGRRLTQGNPRTCLRERQARMTALREAQARISSPVTQTGGEP